MNWIDIIIVALVLMAILAGWARGFILGVLDLLAWAGSLVLGYLFYPHAAQWIGRVFHLGAWLLPVAFLLTTLAAKIVIGLFTGFIARNIPHSLHLDGFNKLLGMIPGAINGWLYTIIFSALTLALPLNNSITNEIRNSRFGPRLAVQSEWANRKLAPVFNDAIRQTMNSLIVRPESKERVELYYTYDKAVARPGLEAEMLGMINRARQRNGLKPLVADPELTAVARAHSRDMFVRGYFAHVDPDGNDPFDRIKSANIKFSVAGENLALAQTLEIAHINLMNSPGHRTNILHPSFGSVGIGVLDGGFHGLMISQEFRD